MLFVLPPHGQIFHGWSLVLPPAVPAFNLLKMITSYFCHSCQSTTGVYPLLAAPAAPRLLSAKLHLYISAGLGLIQCQIVLFAIWVIPAHSQITCLSFVSVYGLWHLPASNYSAVFNSRWTDLLPAPWWDCLALFSSVTLIKWFYSDRLCCNWILGTILTIWYTFTNDFDFFLFKLPESQNWKPTIKYMTSYSGVFS